MEKAQCLMEIIFLKEVSDSPLLYCYFAAIIADENGFLLKNVNRLILLYSTE